MKINGLYSTTRGYNSSHRPVGYIIGICNKNTGYWYIVQSTTVRAKVDMIEKELQAGTALEKMVYDYQYDPTYFEAYILSPYYVNTNVSNLLDTWKQYFGGQYGEFLYNRRATANKSHDEEKEQVNIEQIKKRIEKQTIDELLEEWMNKDIVQFFDILDHWHKRGTSALAQWMAQNGVLQISSQQSARDMQSASNMQPANNVKYNVNNMSHSDYKNDHIESNQINEHQHMNETPAYTASQQPAYINESAHAEAETYKREKRRYTRKNDNSVITAKDLDDIFALCNIDADKYDRKPAQHSSTEKCSVDEHFIDKPVVRPYGNRTVPANTETTTNIGRIPFIHKGQTLTDYYQQNNHALKHYPDFANELRMEIQRILQNRGKRNRVSKYNWNEIIKDKLNGMPINAFAHKHNMTLRMASGIIDAFGAQYDFPAIYLAMGMQSTRRGKEKRMMNNLRSKGINQIPEGW